MNIGEMSAKITVDPTDESFECTWYGDRRRGQL